MRVVVTGMGVISSIGLDPDSFWRNLLNGVSGFKPISIFDTSKYRCKLAGEISNFDPTPFVNKKSIKKYDRIQLLNIGAADMAWKNAGLDSSPYRPDELGIVLGSTYGYIDSVSSFYLESLREGPAYVSPIQFSNTVMNAPAGKIAIRHKITGLCSTIATGETSGIDAMSYAYDFIKAGKNKAVLVGAGSALCEGTFMGFYHTGKLSGSKEGEKEFCAPFDRRGNGIILGEGSGIIVLENLEDARKRNARILAEVKGFGDHFVSNKIKDDKAIIHSAPLPMEAAVKEAGISFNDISLISAGANSTPRTDRIEAEAIDKVFAGGANNAVVTAIKSMTGECLDASAALQTIASICSIRDNKVPPIPNLEKSFTGCRLNYVSRSDSKSIDAVLVHAFSCAGKRRTVVLTRYT